MNYDDSVIHVDRRVFREALKRAQGSLKRITPALLAACEGYAAPPPPKASNVPFAGVTGIAISCGNQSNYSVKIGA